MAVFLQGRIDEEIAFGECYRGFFASSPNFTENKPQFSIRAYLEPLIYQRIFEQAICISGSVSCMIDNISRTATWEALYEGKPMPNVEENAVETHAGSLDAYLPANIPVDSILEHAKG